MEAMQRLREEHASLLSHLAEMRATADAAASMGAAELGDRLDWLFEFAASHLSAHAAAEDLVLYPAVERVLGAPLSAAQIGRDHLEVRQLLESMVRLRSAVATEAEGGTEARGEVQAVLYRLHELVERHINRADQLYLPLLQARLGPEESDELVRRLVTERAGL